MHNKIKALYVVSVFFSLPFLPASYPPPILPSVPSFPPFSPYLPSCTHFLSSFPSLLSPSSFVCFAMMTISFLLKVDHNLRILNFVVSIIIMIIIRGRKKNQWACNQYVTTTMMLAHYLTIIFSKENLFLTSYIVFISIDQNSREILE